ncbi:MAG: ATP-binding protein [Deltaproteobacteria bacterium]|nr:ATP-binding protein [Deltaproteobacteria bacterium]
MAQTKQLVVENFGPIRRVEVPFKDITVLVGPQASGKSLVLQWLKLAVDGNRILGTLGQHGFDVKQDEKRVLGWMFGAGYAGSLRPDTAVRFASKKLSVRALAKGRRRTEAHQALFVPAHRALVMSTGFPLIFRAFDEETPFVVKHFSERVREYLSQGALVTVFPADRRFRTEIRALLDDSLFHGGKVVVESKGLGGRELRLVHEKTRLGIMEWTTGQREVLPLIVGLYDALPAGAADRRKPIEWVIVEEPELGLHPDGVLAVLLVLMETLRRGYRLVLSTHSPLVLDLLWAMQRLRDDPKGPEKLTRIFRVPSTSFTRQLGKAVLGKTQSIIYLDFEDGRVVSRDISGLDPISANAAEAGWGGLLGHSTRIADVLAGAA